MIEASFLLFFVGVTVPIGIWASRKSRGSETDYFLANQTISPYVLALSSAASGYSGFMFTAFMGVAYTQGLGVIWYSIGLLSGYFSVYALITTRLQAMNIGGWALSIAELITFWHGENRFWLRRFIGFITLFFLCFYAAAQLKTCGKSLEVALGYSPLVGVGLSVAAIAFYCWSGGIRASMWTDVVQSLLMILSVVVILAMTVVESGGAANLVERFAQTATDANQTAWFPQNMSIGGFSGLALFLLGYCTVGCCVIGQPHILIRAMAVKEGGDIKKFVRACYGFEAFFSILFTLAGLCTRVILQDVDEFDPELALLLSSREMLPAVATGFVLAGVFSAALSTADSQILSCSASLMRDMPEPPSDSLWGAKIGTLSVTAAAALLALFAGDNIFTLVIFAYTGLGVSIGGLIILRIVNANISETGAIATSAVGFLTVVAWDKLGLGDYAAASLPGFAMFFLTFFAGRRFLRAFRV